MCTISKCFVAICFASMLLTGCKDKEREKSAGEPITHNAATPDTATQQHTVTEDSNLYADVDISPMDMSYFPNRYPQMKIADPGIAPPVMRIIYSRPHLQGRKLFEEILKYGETWRLGANEATELNIFQPVTIGDKKLPAGRYTLYAIPKAGYWTIAVNSSVDQWGLKQDPSHDLVRVQIPVTYYNPVMEYFTMVFEKTDTGANLIMAWDDAVAKLPIKF